MFSVLDAAWYVGAAVLYALGAITLVALYHFVPIVWKSFTSPLRHLPGPPPDSLLYGNFKAIANAENSVPQEQWVEQYGNTLSYRGVFGILRLWTMDTRAVNHILTHSTDFQKPASARYHLARIVGPGILVAEGEQHRNQRRVLNPAFGPAQIRELTEVFVEKSNELRERLQAEITNAGGVSARVDMMTWLSRATLDIIGLAGFNYAFDSLNPEGGVNELNEAFRTIFSPGQSTAVRLFGFLQGVLPPLRIIRTRESRQAEAAQNVMRRIGKQLIADKKAAILAEKREAGHGVERKDLTGRDLLTLLIKANMAVDVPESQRLTDEEVLAQVPTFLVAGHETTSTATMWTLFSLGQFQDVQRKLRDELLSVPTDTPTMDQLNALPYLDMVIKESLRHHAPVPMTSRTAVVDCIVPLETPFVDKQGRLCDHIRVSKGDMVFIPILAMNRKKDLWGEDAHEFKPERWEKVPDAVASIPGVWGNQLSFLGGPRSCIGYRFSLAETKALLFALVRAFTFELGVKPEDVKKKSQVVQRPVINGKGEMPLIIRPVRG